MSGLENSRCLTLIKINLQYLAYLYFNLYVVIGNRYIPVQGRGMINGGNWCIIGIGVTCGCVGEDKYPSGIFYLEIDFSATELKRGK